MAEVASLPRYVHVDGLPANESIEHFTLKWAAYRVLTEHLECPFALLEAGARAGLAARRSRWPRHDALGVRFRSGRAPDPWDELPASQVRIEVLDAATGRWKALSAAQLDAGTAEDETLRAFELQPGGGEAPLRAVAPGRTAGAVRVRHSGGSRHELAQLCAADAKQSRGDLQAWLREAPERLRSVHSFVLVAPPGLCRTEELPPKVGLAEVDLDRLLDADGQPAIRMARWPEALRPAARWAPERTAEFQRHAYYALHGLFGRQLFWFLAQQALDRRRRTGAEPPGGTRERAEAAAAEAPTPYEEDPRVRTYTPADREAVIALWERTGIARPWNDLGAEIDRHQRCDPQLLLVAEAPDGTLAGAVMGGWDGRRGWVYHLAVDAGWRRQGIGRALLAEVERRLAAMGCPKVMLMVREDNAGVVDFYARTGYTREAVHVLSKGAPRG